MRFLPVTLALLLAAAPLAGCDSADLASTGRVRVLLTDAPLENATNAFVTVERIELIGADGPAYVLSDSARVVDLLTLQDGVTAEMADVEVPAGTYEQLRLIVADDARLLFDDDTELNLKVPSGTETGIKILLPAFELDEEDDVAEITVDFDVFKSFVEAGNSGSYIFKPVLKPLSLVVDGAEIDLENDAVEADSTALTAR